MTSSFGMNNSCVRTGATTGGVLAELIAQGAADVHLTADPKVTYWRLQINKCTNFAMESILQTFTGQPAWGTEVSATLNRTGDLIYWMYVLLDIPAITAQALPSGSTSFTGCRFPCANPCNPCGDPPAQGECVPGCSTEVLELEVEDSLDIDDCTGLARPYAHWVNEIGFAAIARASFSIGGQIIDTVFSYYMHMWEELSGQPGKRLEEMIGKRFTMASLVEDSSYSRRLYVPLPFYFTRYSGNALPLVSLQFHSVQVHVCFAPLERMIQVSDCDVNVIRCSDGQPVNNQDLNAILDTTYIYLDMQERDRFAVGSFQQLITQVQQFSTTSKGSRVQAQLNFNHPTLELLWAVQRKCQAAANNTFNFSGYQNRDPVVRVCLRLNNLQRTDREGPYYRLSQPWQHHTNIPKGFIYSYSFALHPESCQPSGTLNMSRIDNIELGLVLQDELASEEVAVYVFARSFNILRFKQGSFSAWSFNIHKFKHENIKRPCGSHALKSHQCVASAKAQSEWMLGTPFTLTQLPVSGNRSSIVTSGLSLGQSAEDQLSTLAFQRSATHWGFFPSRYDPAYLATDKLLGGEINAPQKVLLLRLVVLLLLTATYLVTGNLNRQPVVESLSTGSAQRLQRYGRKLEGQSNYLPKLTRTRV